MRMVEHKDNRAWWHAKVGAATAGQVAEFAREYKRAEGGGTMGVVAVAEGADWVSGYHIKSIVNLTRAEGAFRPDPDLVKIAVNLTRAEGAVAVWVSDGVSAQCVWRAHPPRVRGRLSLSDSARRKYYERHL